MSLKELKKAAGKKGEPQKLDMGSVENKDRAAAFIDEANWNIGDSYNHIPNAKNMAGTLKKPVIKKGQKKYLKLHERGGAVTKKLAADLFVSMP